jgi:hypothetical protein
MTPVLRTQNPAKVDNISTCEYNLYIMVNSFAPLIVLLTTVGSCTAFVVSNQNQHTNPVTALSAVANNGIDRRQLFQCTASFVLALPSIAAATGPGDGNLPDLPPGAIQSYLQYRVPLQISADYYLWDLQDKMADTNEWGEVGQIFQINNNRGQGQPNKVERDFINPMRILGLSMPPDIADEMRESQFAFEKAMAKITKTTLGIRRDLPVEIDKNAVGDALKGWDEGRIALNGFFKTLNEATGLNELKPLPPPGPNQNQEYGRSQRRYMDLAKKTKLCQNRGGPALSQAWGGLMISGYMQDSCGIPDLEAYFYQ